VTSLPAYTPSDFQAHAADDVAAIIAREHPSPAVYKSQGAGDGVLVTIYVSAPPERASHATDARSPGPTHRRRTPTTIVAAADPAGADAGGGVTGDGHIIELAANDTLLVHAANAGMTGSDVTLRVTGKARLVAGAYWSAEVHP
jgi:hypothetical protein